MENTWNEYYLTATRGNLQNIKAVCCSDLSLFCNNLIDIFQNRSFMHLLRQHSFAPGIKALDIGCGCGRWVRRMNKTGMKAHGIDISIAAINRIPSVERKLLGVGSAAFLPFRDDTFTLVSDVTVIHHLPYDTQEIIGKEISRVLSDGGCWLLLEHLAPDGKSSKDVSWQGVYPRSFEEWKRFMTSNRMKIIAARRLHYTPLTRSILNRFEAMEKIYVKYRKDKLSGKISPTRSYQSPDNSSQSQQHWTPSRRHKAYARIKSMFLNIPMGIDFFIGLLLERKKGSHIAILAQKAAATSTPV
jgi:ubiquinone/menaquinone biosynthesis C-methylase UbiE